MSFDFRLYLAAVSASETVKGKKSVLGAVSINFCATVSELFRAFCFLAKGVREIYLSVARLKACKSLRHNVAASDVS